MVVERAFPLLLASTVVFLSGCMSPPEGLDLSLDRSTAKNLYRVQTHPVAEPVKINKIHSWEVKVLSPAGQPVTNARISVDGGMPQHGHGLPTQPRVTRELGEGRYLMEGMKFSMSGWWEIKLNIEAPAGSDEVTFNTGVATSAR